MNVIRAENLHAAYGERTIFDDLNFGVDRGRSLLIAGPNGSGKTTLLNCLTGFGRPNNGRLLLSGDGRAKEFVFSASPLRSLFNRFGPAAVAALGIRRTWQIPRLFSDVSVADHFALASHARQITTSHRDIWLADFQLRPESFVRDLSFGQRKLLQFALANHAATSGLILDEPFSGLDEHAAALLRAGIAKAKSVDQRAIVVVEHPSNSAHLVGIVDEVLELGPGNARAVIHSGSTVAATNGGEYLLRKSLAECGLATVGHHRRAGASCIEFGAGSANLDREVSVSELDDEIPDLPGRIAALWTYVSRLPEHVQVLLIEAPNGWGKTTFLRHVAALKQRPRPNWCGEDEDAQPNIRFVPIFESSLKNVRVNAIMRLARTPGFDDVNYLLARRVGTLSGGELKRIELLVTLNSGRRLTCLLDEPTNSLDARGIAMAARLMQNSGMFAPVIGAEPLRPHRRPS